MSVDIMARVWKTSCQTHTQKLVLIALADNANDQSYCWPSMETIARKCDLTVNGVRKQVKALVEYGLLKVETSRGKTSNGYILFPNKPPTACRVEPPTVLGVSNSNPQRRSPQPPTVLGFTPNTVDPNHKEPSIEPSTDSTDECKTVSSVAAIAATPVKKPMSEKAKAGFKIQKAFEELKNLWLVRYAKHFPGRTYRDWPEVWRIKAFLKQNPDLNPSAIVDIAEHSWETALKAGARYPFTNAESLSFVLSNFTKLESELKRVNGSSTPTPTADAWANHVPSGPTDWMENPI